MRLIAGVCLVLFSLPGIAAERYVAENAKLSKKIVEVLRVEGFCQSTKECLGRDAVFSESGDGVYQNFYGITDPKLISKIVEVVARDGKALVGDASITISFHAEPHSEYMGLKSFFKKPFMTLHIE